MPRAKGTNVRERIYPHYRAPDNRRPGTSIHSAGSRAIRESKDILVCRLIGGKVTYVHRQLWPALVRLSKQLDPDHLAAIRETHTATGKHKIEVVAFPEWVPSDVSQAAASLTAEQASEMLRIAGMTADLT